MYFTDDSGRIFDHPVNGTDDNRLSLSQAEETRDNGIVDFSSAADSTISENNKMLFWVLTMAMCISIWAFIYFETDGCDGEPILAIATLIGAIAATLYCGGSLVCEYNLTSAFLCAAGASVLGMMAGFILITIVCIVIAVVMALITASISIVLAMLLIGLVSGS